MDLRVVMINDVIPADLLLEIFFYCLPWDPLKYEQPDVTIAPMLLCHVCSQWRDMAFQTPLLWTQLYHVAFLRSPVGAFDPRDISFLRWWHERVQGVPASLRFAFKEDDDSDDEIEGEFRSVESRDFISFIVHFMSNARYLNLDSHYNHILRTLCREHPLSCPNLHTLVMRRGVGRKAPDVGHNTIAATLSSDNLNTEKDIPVSNQQYICRLAVEDLFMSVEDVTLVVNFSNITHLNLVLRISLRGWFSLLRESTNLIYGSFSITFYGEVNNYIPKSQVLPHLQEMSFENFGVDLQQSFLDGIVLPSLTGLRVDHHIPLSIDHLHRVLASTPSLRTLQLGPTWIPDEALSHFVFVPGDLNPAITPLSDIVPHLESIHFEGTTSMIDLFSPESRDVVISALNGDWLQLGRPGSRISHVYFGNFWDDGNVEWREVVDLVDDLQKSMPDGVELAVRPYYAPRLWLSHWKHGDFTDEFEDLRFEI